MTLLLGRPPKSILAGLISAGVWKDVLEESSGAWGVNSLPIDEIDGAGDNPSVPSVKFLLLLVKLLLLFVFVTLV